MRRPITGLPDFQIVFDRFPFLVGQLEKAHEEDRKIGLCQCLDTREHIFSFLFGISFSHHDRRAETEFLEFLREKRHREFWRIV